MRYCYLILLVLYCFVVVNGKAMAEANTDDSKAVEQLAVMCFEDWQKKDWKLGDSQVPAVKNEAFRKGIQKICQARAELFSEGYEIYPFIGNNTKKEVYALVFSASVDDIKKHLKSHIPPLQTI